VPSGLAVRAWLPAQASQQLAVLAWAALVVRAWAALVAQAWAALVV